MGFEGFKFQVSNLKFKQKARKEDKGKSVTRWRRATALESKNLSVLVANDFETSNYITAPKSPLEGFGLYSVILLLKI